MTSRRSWTHIQGERVHLLLLAFAGSLLFLISATRRWVAASSCLSPALSCPVLSRSLTTPVSLTHLHVHTLRKTRARCKWLSCRRSPNKVQPFQQSRTLPADENPDEGRAVPPFETIRDVNGRAGMTLWRAPMDPSLLEPRFWHVLLYALLTARSV